MPSVDRRSPSPMRAILRAGGAAGAMDEERGVDFRASRSLGFPLVRRPTGAGVVLVALLLMSGRPTRAADPRLDAARAHSQEGDAYYKLEKYTSAITEYEQAYLAKPDPSFLYNIAQCHRLMGEGAEAIKFYRRFLKDAPNAPNRAVAEKHIKDLEDASRGTPPPPATTPAPSSTPPAATVPPPATPPTEPPLAPLPSSPT